MLTQSDSGATQCCKCECHRYREPKWACSLCGRGFTRKFNVLRHLDTKHEGRGTPIPYGEYRNGQSSAEIMNLAARAAAPKSEPGISPKSRRILALLDARTNETVNLFTNFRLIHMAKNINISARVCNICLSLTFDGYVFTNNGDQTPLPVHSCRCEWLLDYPDLDSRRDLAERCLNEKIGSSIAQILWSYTLPDIPICIQFVHLDDLERTRIDYLALKESIKLTKNESEREVFKILSELKREKVEAIMDDISKNYILLDLQQFWWCSYIRGIEGIITVSRDDAAMFLQFFKSTTSKVKLQSSDRESCYSLTIM